MNNLRVIFIYEGTPRRTDTVPEGLADLDDNFDVYGTYLPTDGSAREPWEATVTWRFLFHKIAPFLMQNLNEQTINQLLAAGILKHLSLTGSHEIINQIVLNNKLIEAIGLIKAVFTDGYLYWYLTPSGEQVMRDHYTVKKVRTQDPVKADLR